MTLCSNIMLPFKNMKKSDQTSSDSRFSTSNAGEIKYPWKNNKIKTMLYEYKL